MGLRCHLLIPLIAMAAVVTAAETPEAVVAALQDALERDDAQALSACFDGEGVLLAVNASLDREIVPEDQRAMLAGLVVDQIGVQLTSNDLMDFARYRIVRREPQGEDRLELTLRCWDVDGLSTFYRLWLRQRAGDWGIVDYEEAQAGVRFSTLMALGMMAVQAQEPWVGSAKAMLQPVVALANGDFEPARAYLEQAAEPSGPAVIQSLHWLLAASVAIADGDFTAAQQAIDASAGLEQRAPYMDLIEAEVALGLGEPQRALGSVDLLEFVVGPHGDSEALRGRAQLMLGQTEAAIASFERGLEDSPGHWECLTELSLVLPPERQDEIFAHTRRASEPALRFEEIADHLYWAEDHARLAAYAGAAHAHDPADADAGWYLASALRGLERDQEALAVLDRVLAAAAPDDDSLEHCVIMRAELALAQQGAAEALAGVGPGWRRQVFEQLGDELIGEQRHDELELLVAAHEASDPDDPWLPYYRAEVHRLRGEHAVAETHYAAGMTPSLHPDLRYWYRYQRVGNLCQAGTPERALELLPSDEDAAAVWESIVDHVDTAPPEPMLPLLERHIAAGAGGPALALARARTLARAGRYEEAITAAAAVTLDPEAEDYWELLVEQDDIQVRAALDAGWTQRAMTAARASTARDGDPYFELVVEAASGQRVAATAIYRELIGLGYTHDELSADEHAGEAIQQWFPDGEAEVPADGGIAVP